ncbi:MAG: 30S ribosomal protein S20 [Chloroherpetonaceae bacterium]|nr:30S ribosomal protein S20 [Chloroherpetonaceae bacterium]MDW8437182.1 30S ribosomal protein S20 [Chloroherpetonaceae bacterium]
MPQHKSAEKRVRQSKRRNAYNRQRKAEMKSLIKNVKRIVASKGSLEDAQKALSEAFKKLDKMATKGVIHKNNAANKKSKLTKLVKSLAAARSSAQA